MRIAGYVRVSREEQLQGYSLAAQTDAIKRECSHRGHVLVAEFRDEGRSAKLDSLENRPGFQAAVEAVKSGAADAVMVHKVDRAARNLRVFLQVMAAIDGALISIVENIDYASAHGRLVAHVLASVAQYFADNLATEIRKGMDERKRQGLWNGPMPFGARKQDEHGKLPPVPDREPFLRSLIDGHEWSRYDALQLIFKRAAGGAALSEIVAELQRIGFNLTATGVGHMLMNRFYLGELSLGRHRSRGGAEAWVQGAHEPLVDQATFDDAQRIRIEREGRRQSGRHGIPVYAVSGLVRCGGCNGPVMCRKDSTGKVRLYCRNRYERRNCDQPSCKFETVEVQIFHALDQYTPSSEIAERVADVLNGEQPDIEAQRARINEQRKRLRDLYVFGEMPLAEYRERTNELERALMALPAAQTGPDTRVIINFLQDLPAAYRAATDPQRNDLLRRVFIELMVKDKQLVTVRPRPALDRIMRANLSQVLAELNADREKLALEITASRSSTTTNFACVSWNPGRVHFTKIPAARSRSIIRSGCTPSPKGLRSSMTYTATPCAAARSRARITDASVRIYTSTNILVWARSSARTSGRLPACGSTRSSVGIMPGPTRKSILPSAGTRAFALCVEHAATHISTSNDARRQRKDFKRPYATLYWPTIIVRCPCTIGPMVTRTRAQSGTEASPPGRNCRRAWAHCSLLTVVPGCDFWRRLRRCDPKLLVG